MATSRPFAYNTGAPISGTTQTGDLAIGVSDEPYSDNYGDVIWWNGPDEELGYVITVPVSGNTQPTPILDVFASVGFNRSADLTEGSFVELTNNVFNQSFTNGTECKTWLNNNGYWTSYSGITCYDSIIVEFGSTPNFITGIQCCGEYVTYSGFTVGELHIISDCWSDYLNAAGLSTISFSGSCECVTPTPTPTPTVTPTNTETPTPTVTPTSSITPTPTVTPTSTNTPTNTPTPSVTNTQTPTGTAAVTPTPTTTTTPTPTPTPGGAWGFYFANGGAITRAPNNNGDALFSYSGSSNAVYNPNYTGGTFNIYFNNNNKAGTSYLSQFTTLKDSGGTITINQGSSTAIYSGTSSNYSGSTGTFLRLIVNREAQMIQSASTPFVSGTTINVVVS